MSAQELSPAEQEVVARFEAAEYPAEVLRAHRELEAAEQDAR
jgi:hypothetical protein